MEPSGTFILLRDLVFKVGSGHLAALIEAGHLWGWDAYDRFGPATEELRQRALKALASHVEHTNGPRSDDYAFELAISSGGPDSIWGLCGLHAEDLEGEQDESVQGSLRWSVAQPDSASHESLEDRRKRRLGRLLELGGALVRQPGGSWHQAGVRGALNRLLEEEQEAHRRQSDRKAIQIDLDEECERLYAIDGYKERGAVHKRR